MYMEAVGLHGTCVSNAVSIEQEGFVLSDNGDSQYRGTGHYFWESYKNSEFARKLAIEWWRHCYHRNKFREKPNPSCAVIKADLKAKIERFLDFETKEVKGKFIHFLESIEETLNEESPDGENLCQSYDLFIDMYEEVNQCKLEIIRASIPLINKKLKRTARFQLLGNPVALIVKSSECIGEMTIEYPQNV